MSLGRQADSLHEQPAWLGWQQGGDSLTPCARLLRIPCALTWLSAADGHFIYLDGSQAEAGDVAHLVSPACSPHRPQCFRFWYHMYGVAHTMALRVYVASGSAAPVLVWSESGNKGNRWRPAEVSLTHRGTLQVMALGLGSGSSGPASSLEPFSRPRLSHPQVILEGVRGEDFRSDVALDDISLGEGYCSGDTPSPTPTTTSAPPSPGECAEHGNVVRPGFSYLL